MNIPNLLCVFRIFLLLPLGWAMFALGADSWIAFAIFIIAGITDFLDGWLARRLGKTSAFGAMLDQICDKIFIVGTLLLLVAVHQDLSGPVPLILPALLIIAREFLVSGLREYAAQQGGAIPVDRLGKIKTAVQFISIACWLSPPLMVFDDADASETLRGIEMLRQLLAFAGLWLAAVLGWISAWRYFRSVRN